MLKSMEIGKEGPDHPEAKEYGHTEPKKASLLESSGITDQFGRPVKSEKEEDEENLLYKFLMKLRGEKRGLAQDVESPNPEMHPDIINGAPGMKFRLPL